MTNKRLVATAALGLLIAAAAYKDAPRYIRIDISPVTTASAAEPPNCPHGLEPGGGPMRCADPNDPNSYLNKKPAKPQTKTTGYTISADGKEIITPDGKHWARRPDWMPSPQQDPRFCARVTHSASDLNRCVQTQNQEFLPSQADYQNALRQQSAFLDRMLRDMCAHGDRNACR